MLPSTSSRPAKSGGAALRAEIRLVRDLLDQVIAEQEGPVVARSVEKLRVRTLALRRRYVVRDERLLERRLRELDPAVLFALARAFTVFSQLVNVCEARDEARRRGHVQGRHITALLRRLRAKGVPVTTILTERDDDSEQSRAEQVSVMSPATALARDQSPRF